MHFPCAVVYNWSWWAGPQSDLMSAPSPPLGPQTGVCLLFPSPRGGIHCGVVWPIWATCTLPGLWCWGSGILAGVGRQGAPGAGGAGLTHFSLGDPLQEGPCGSRRESDLLKEVWLCRSTVLGVCSERASSLTGTGSLWDFGWGVGKGDGAAKRLCSPTSCALSSGAQQLCLPLSSSPPVL